MGIKRIKHQLKLLFLIFFVTGTLQNTYAGPKIETWKTPNQARVYFVQNKSLPMIDIRVVFDAGSARDQGKPGVSHLTNALMADGAGRWSAQEIATRFESIGAIFSTNALRDMAWLSLRSLSDEKILKNALETFEAIIARPSFNDDDFKREQKRTLIGLKQEKESPSDIAEKLFYKQLYVNHPYASPPDGTETSVAALTRNDIINFYKQHYVARNATITIVGNVNKRKAIQIAQSLIKALPAGNYLNLLPPIKPITQSKIEAIDFPSKQTHIFMGGIGMKRGDPDYYSLYIGNHILGGSGLVSVLSNVIREKRGLAYSVYSYFMPMRNKGPFQMGMQTKNNQAQKAIKLLKETLAAFIKNGPTNAQIISAKKNITGGFPLRIDSNKKIIEYLGMIGFYNLPLNYLDTFNQKINAVSREQIIQAFKRRVSIYQLVGVMVGGS